MDMSLGELRELVIDLKACSSWGRKELDMTERLNWTELNWTDVPFKIIEQREREIVNGIEEGSEVCNLK